MPQAGWYFDPMAADRLRLWDGACWCEDTRPWTTVRSAQRVGTVTDERRSWLQIGSAVAVIAVVFALVGMPGRFVSPLSNPDGAAGSVFDQTITPVGMAVADQTAPNAGVPTTAGVPVPAPVTVGPVPVGPVPAGPVTVRPVAAGPIAPRRVPQAPSAEPLALTVGGSPTDFQLTGFRWDPCHTITVSTDGPAVEGIVAELASITGLQLKMVVGPADIVVGWGSIPIRGAIGLAILGTNGSTIVNSVVTISPRGTSVLPTVLRHEMGHALGLDHAKKPDEIMYPVTRVGAPLDFQAGDLAGLRAIGSTGAGC